MPQDDRHERKAGRSTRRRTTVLHAVLAIALAGASRVAVTSPTYTALEQNQVAKEGAVSVNYGGAE